MNRIILHSDMNNFYASVECMLNPKLRDKYVAVCGNREDRHGIVLAKNEKAKKKGVSTGEPIWKAQIKCPELITVPPNFEEYSKYSGLAHDIYSRYTDLIEPFGPDECWLDVSGSTRLFGNGENIAYTIKEQIKSELGLTVSIGVSFNKIFAKLGSDIKKPDAVTCINKDNFKEIVWPLSADCLLYVGRATKEKLAKVNINTIGDIANTSPYLLKKWFGKNGGTMWTFANGLDNSRVAPMSYTPPPKSIGHGITCTADLENDEEVWKIIFELSADIVHRLYKNNCYAGGIAISLRDKTLSDKEFQRKLSSPLRSQFLIAKAAFDLYNTMYEKNKPIRAVSVRVTELVGENYPMQLDMFTDTKLLIKKEKVDAAIENLRNRFGKHSVTYASIMGDLKLPRSAYAKHQLPNMMYK